MKMTTFKLIVFRFFNYTVCRFDWSAILFKKLLIKILIKEKEVPYSPSSHYFYLTDLLQQPEDDNNER